MSCSLVATLFRVPICSRLATHPIVSVVSRLSRAANARFTGSPWRRRANHPLRFH